MRISCKATSKCLMEIITLGESVKRKLQDFFGKEIETVAYYLLKLWWGYKHSNVRQKIGILGLTSKKTEFIEEVLTITGSYSPNHFL